MKDTEVLKRLLTLQGLKPPASDEFVAKWIDDIKIAIAHDSEENIGFGNALKAIERCISRNKRKKNGLDGVLKTSKRGIYIITDGSFAVKSKHDFKMPVKDNQKEVADKVLKAVEEASKENKTKILLPTRAELDTIIKVYKALPKAERTTSPEYDFGKGLPLVNAELLSDILTFFPMATHARVCKERGELSTVYIDFVPYEALLLPIKKH